MSLKLLFEENDELVLDSSIPIAYLMNEKKQLTSLLDTFVFNEDSSIIIYNHRLSLTEIYYIICRKKSREEAKKVLKNLENIWNIISTRWLFEKASIIKCQFAISLPDCFSISLGIFQNCPILFLEEKELSDKIVKQISNEFSAKIKII
ncbi:MAG: hypothetical protein ACOC35_09825 [Promethearchaeia archaeon]